MRGALYALVPAALLLAVLLGGASDTTTSLRPVFGAPASGVKKDEGPVADNSRCFVCHANYDFNDEKLALVHAKANIGCVRCHGESSPHSTDEDGLTPPDFMYGKGRIRFNCLGCHNWQYLIASDKKNAARTDLKEKPNHQAVLEGSIPDKKVCTDCHGEHRLGHRTRLWDKRTGKLTYRDKTPQMLGGSSSSQ